MAITQNLRDLAAKAGVTPEEADAFDEVVDFAVLDLLIDRLPQQADNVEESGHLNAARYMRTAVRLLQSIKERETSK